MTAAMTRGRPMRFSLSASVVALILSASALAAQQPETPGPGGHGKMSDRGAMPMIDSLDHRLDSLVDRMNRSTGNQKVQSMAAVINELVGQRKLMRTRMHEMMGQGGMMGMMDESKSTGRRPQVQPNAGGSDSTDHAPITHRSEMDSCPRKPLWWHRHGARCQGGCP